MWNIAEQTAEAATNAKVCRLGTIGNESACHILSHFITSYHPKCKLSMDIAIKRKFYEVNSNPAFP